MPNSSSKPAAFPMITPVGCPMISAVSSRLSWGLIHPSLLLSLFFLLPIPTPAQLPPEPLTVRIGILSLFHPHTLLLSTGHPVTILLDGTPRILDPLHPVTLRSSATGLEIDDTPARTLTLPAATFTLTVPDKLTRTYRGALTVTARNGVLIPILTLETELAVASIVAAESPPHAPFEALKAQAIASRSFLLATRPAHAAFDSCDTTHCQYLRAPPATSSPAALATLATGHQVLTWRPSPEAPPQLVAAMYSRSCGGQTRVPPTSVTTYPFYSVRCTYCRRHPELWFRSAVTIPPASESARLAFNRTHGWSAIPSNTYTASASLLNGRGIGHGIGLCQLGAADLAVHGLPSSEILARYFPNTSLTQLAPQL